MAIRTSASSSSTTTTHPKISRYRTLMIIAFLWIMVVLGIREFTQSTNLSKLLSDSEIMTFQGTKINFDVPSLFYMSNNNSISTTMYEISNNASSSSSSSSSLGATATTMQTRTGTKTPPTTTTNAKTSTITTNANNIINVTFRVQGDIITSKMEQTPIQQNKEIVDFEHQEGVVIAVKIHSPGVWPQLKQSLCLLNKAYNNRVLYDIVVFTSEPVPQDLIDLLKPLVAPANFTVYVDDQTLEQQIESMTPQQRKITFKRCNVTGLEQLGWRTRCTDEGMVTMPLGYNWQCEFRAKHLWRHRALKPYKYMMWFDSDAMPTEVWKQDPVAEFIRNDLVLMFDNFPQGSSRGFDMQQRIEQTFGKRLCALTLNANGQLYAKGGTCWDNSRIPQVHGFFHITDLDFYRSDIVRKWQDNLIGDTKFSRRLDDQIGVTVPAAMLAPSKSWDMRKNGIHLNVWHNGMMDGKEKWKGGGYKKWWQTNGKTNFPEAYDTCNSHVVNSGR